MRVALVLRCFDARRGGAESWTVQFAGRLLAAGHDVHVVAGEFAPHDLRVTEHRFEPHPLPSVQARRIAEVLRRVPADIVHDAEGAGPVDVFQPHTGSRVLNLERDLAALPRGHRLRLAVSPAFRRLRRDLAASERRQLREARMVVAVSHSVAATLCQRYGLPSAAVAVVPNGVDTVRYSPAARVRERRAARASLGLGDAVTFLFVALNFRLKGLDTALAALRSLARDGRHVRLLVAGAGAVEEYRRKAGPVADRVQFLGHCDAMEPLYAAADVLVHPTFHDACSLATLEALASGLPVVTTRANGAADGMTDGREGFVLPCAGDAAALAAAMAALLDPGRRSQSGAAAAALGQARSFAANFDGILAVYRAVLERRAAQ